MPRKEIEMQADVNSSSDTFAHRNISQSPQLKVPDNGAPEVNKLSVPNESTQQVKEVDNGDPQVLEVGTKRKQKLETEQPISDAIEVQKAYNREHFASNDRTIQSSSLQLIQSKGEEKVVNNNSGLLSTNNFSYAVSGNQLIGERELKASILYAIQKHDMRLHQTPDGNVYIRIKEFFLSEEDFIVIRNHQNKKLIKRMNNALNERPVNITKVNVVDPWITDDGWDVLSHESEISKVEEKESFLKQELPPLPQRKTAAEKREERKAEKERKKLAEQQENSNIQKPALDNSTTSVETKSQNDAGKPELSKENMNHAQGESQSLQDIVQFLKADLVREREEKAELRAAMQSMQKTIDRLSLQVEELLNQTKVKKDEPIVPPKEEVVPPKEVQQVVPPKEVQQQQDKVQVPKVQQEQEVAKPLITKFSDDGINAQLDIDKVEKPKDIAKAMNDIINLSEEQKKKVVNSGKRDITTPPITQSWSKALQKDLVESDQTVRTTAPKPKPPAAPPRASTLIEFKPSMKNKAAKVSDCPPGMISISWINIKKSYKEEKDIDAAVKRYYQGLIKTDVYTMRLKWEKVYGKKIHNKWLSRPTSVWEAVSQNKTYKSIHEAIRRWRSNAIAYEPKGMTPIEGWYSTKIRGEKATKPAAEKSANQKQSKATGTTPVKPSSEC